jgi:hypothetical protein
MMGNDRRVSIRGDAVGNVIATGDGNTIEAHVTAAKHRVELPDPATVDIARELAAIRAVLASLGSEHDRKVGRALDDASDEAGKPTPDKDELGRALDRALGYAKSAAGFAAEATRLAPHLRSAVAWLGDQWHALLTYLA